MRQFGVDISSRWIPYFESKFTANNFTSLLNTADIAVISGGSWFARYHKYHTQNRTLNTKIKTLQRQGPNAPVAVLQEVRDLQLEQQMQKDREDRIASTPDGMSDLNAKQVTEYGLDGYKLLFDSIASLPRGIRKPVFIVRSPPAFGTPTVPPSNTGTFQNFPQYNKVVLAIGDTVKSMTSDPKYSKLVEDGAIRFVDGTTYSFDSRANLRTSCPLFTGSKEQCACHMNDQLGWRSLNQQLLNVMCAAPPKPAPPALNKEAMDLISLFHLNDPTVLSAGSSTLARETVPATVTAAPAVNVLVPAAAAAPFMGALVPATAAAAVVPTMPVPVPVPAAMAAAAPMAAPVSAAPVPFAQAGSATPAASSPVSLLQAARYDFGAAPAVVPASRQLD